MKNFLLVAIALLGLATPAQAQHRAFTPGITLGYARTHLTGSSGYSTVTHVAYQGGLTGDVYVSDRFSFHPEALFSWRAYDLTNEDLSRDVSYLDVPLLARIHAGGLFFEVGPQVSVPLTVKNEEGEDVKKEVNPVALDYVLGLGYQIPAGLSLGVRYDGGATPVFKNESGATVVGHAKAKSQTLLLMLGYAFGGR